MQIRLDDLSGPDVHALLQEHLRSMRELSPPESVHAMDIAKLRQPDITFWTVWSGAGLLACGALRELTPTHGRSSRCELRSPIAEAAPGVPC